MNNDLTETTVVIALQYCLPEWTDTAVCIVEDNNYIRR